MSFRGKFVRGMVVRGIDVEPFTKCTLFFIAYFGRNETSDT
jgi:hypothetical protein